MKELLKTKEAAQLLGVSISTLKKWRLDHKGPPYIKGAGKSGHPLYRRTVLMGFLNDATTTPGGATGAGAGQ